MDIKEQVERLLEGILKDAEHLFVVDIKVSSSKQNMKISVLLDGDQGLDIEDCALVSRKLDEGLEALNWTEHSYVLEVSSPGIDMPLQLLRQYKKNKGRRLRILLNDGKEKTGELSEVLDTHILIQEEVKEKKKKILVPAEIKFDEIKKCIVLVSFK